MNLKEFNPNNTMGKSGCGRFTPPRLGVNFKTGLFRFNKTALEFLELSEGHQVKIYQDLHKDTDWYLEVVQENGFVLVKRERKDGNVLAFSTTALAREIADSITYVETSGRLPIQKPIALEGGRQLYKLSTDLLRNK